MRTRLVLLGWMAWAAACGDVAPDPSHDPSSVTTPAAEGTLGAPASAPSVARPTTEADGRWIDLGPLGDRRHRARDVRAWVPAHDEDARLPVLVVLDGQASSTWFRIPETVATLVEEGAIEPWIVLAIDSSADRTRELGRSDGRFARFVEDVVLPAARDALPIREGRDHTAILGYSYGGLTAVAAAVAEPDTFGRVIAMSASASGSRSAT